MELQSSGRYLVRIKTYENHIRILAEKQKRSYFTVTTGLGKRPPPTPLHGIGRHHKPWKTSHPMTKLLAELER